MAVAPLFISDMTTLKAALRLSGVTQPDTDAIIDRVVSEVRVGFYDRLGTTRVSTLVALPSVENPTTTDGILRTRAETTEVLWVRAMLLSELPTLFVDSSGQLPQVWQEEGLARGMGQTDAERVAEDLMQRVESALSLLADGGSANDKIKIASLGPATTPPQPGDTAHDPALRWSSGTGRVPLGDV